MFKSGIKVQGAKSRESRKQVKLQATAILKKAGGEIQILNPTCAGLGVSYLHPAFSWAEITFIRGHRTPIDEEALGREFRHAILHVRIVEFIQKVHGA